MALKASRETEKFPKSKGQVLLAKRGLDTDKMEKLMSQMDFSMATQPTQLIPSGIEGYDLETYLNHYLDVAIYTALEDVKKDTQDQYNRDLIVKMDKEWSTAKQEIVEELNKTSYIQSLSANVSTSAVPTTTAASSMMTPVKFGGYTSSVGTPSTPLGGGIISGSSKYTPMGMYPPNYTDGYSIYPQTPLRTPTSSSSSSTSSTSFNKVARYISIIQNMNDARKYNRPFPLISEFLKVESSIDSRDQDELSDSWDLLRCILDEEDGFSGNSKLIEGQFKSTFLNTNSKEEEILKWKFIQGACHFLERQYFQVIESELKKRTLDDVNRSVNKNVSNSRQKIRAYAEMIIRRSDSFNSILTGNALEEKMKWMVIYYALRTGRIDVALEETKGKEPTLHTIIDTIYSRDQHDTNDTQYGRLRDIYSQRKTVADEYEELVYNLLGKFDTTKSYKCAVIFQDYLWIHLRLLKSVKTTTSNDNTLTTLGDLQKKFSGAAAGSKLQPLNNFQALLATLQFEKAINFICNETPNHLVEGVHFALSLNYYGVLRQPTDSSSSAALYRFIDSKPTFNFVRLIKEYIKVYCKSNLLASLHYLFTIQNLNDRDACITELALETNQINTLFGKVKNGVRETGPIDLLYIDPKQRQAVMRMVAQEYYHRGNYREAIECCDLAEDFDSMLSIFNNQLSRILSSIPNAESKSLIDLGDELYSRCETQGWIGVKDETKDTFFLLARLTLFFTSYNTGAYGDALKIIKSIETMRERLTIIPFQSKYLNQCLDKFNELDECIKRNIISILISTLTSIYKQYQDHKQLNIPQREQLISDLRDEAKLIVNFAGRIKYQMPPTAYSNLLSIESSMYFP
eukprot:TRINITY_DN2297_c0_g1_i2.p1 TRINITY_DN2297_c0_g1~~TRINITY_DN2297_c0_g1_i2.p1  ORF type:complete len:901 (+),score=221.35 TRINITY_DN2297_c0_g1_i2:137-2704(+)